MQFIFDLDGTLLDSQSTVLDSLKYSIGKHAPIYLNKLHKGLIGPPILDLLGRIMSNKDLISAISMEFRAHYDNKGVLETKLFPGVYQGLQELSKDNTILISTNKPLVPTKKILNLLKISSFICNAVTIDSGNFRNKSDIVKKILSKNNKSNSIVIGDSIDDYESAKHNGIDFIYCSYGYGYVDCKSQSIATVETSNALFRLLNRL